MVPKFLASMWANLRRMFENCFSQLETTKGNTETKVKFMSLSLTKSMRFVGKEAAAVMVAPVLLNICRFEGCCGKPAADQLRRRLGPQ